MEDRSRRIVETAIELAERGGFEAVRLRDVAAHAGVALGTDLALPSALLTGLMDELGERGQREGAYLGWWNFAAKLNLALAAGLALPLLDVFGYTPGARDADALWTLTVAYCLLPCALKLLAAGLLHTLLIRPARQSAAALSSSLKAHS